MAETLNLFKKLSAGSTRTEFAVCPKDEHYPKCFNCASLIRSGDCPLGKSGIPSRVNFSRREYSGAMEDIAPDEATHIGSNEKGSTAIRSVKDKADDRIFGQGKPPESYRKKKRGDKGYNYSI